MNDAMNERENILSRLEALEAKKAPRTHSHPALWVAVTCLLILGVLMVTVRGMDLGGEEAQAQARAFGGGGGVAGPASSTDGTVAIFSGTSGDTLKEGNITDDGTDITLSPAGNDHLTLSHGDGTNGPLLTLNEGNGVRLDLESDGNPKLRIWSDSVSGGRTFFDYAKDGGVGSINFRQDTNSKLSIDTAVRINAPFRFLPNTGVIQDSSGHAVAQINDTGDEFDVVGQLNIGSGTAITNTHRGTNTTDVGSISAQTCTDVSVTVTGAAAGDDCSYGISGALSAGLGLSCHVAAADTCTVRVCNATSGAVSPGSLTYSCRTWAP